MSSVFNEYDYAICVVYFVAKNIVLAGVKVGLSKSIGIEIDRFYAKSDCVVSNFDFTFYSLVTQNLTVSFAGYCLTICIVA